MDALHPEWLAEAADAVGVEARREDLRLGVAVSLGQLIELLATGDVVGTTAARERFVEMWESARTSTSPGP